MRTELVAKKFKSRLLDLHLPICVLNLSLRSLKSRLPDFYPCRLTSEPSLRLTHICLHTKILSLFSANKQF